MTEHSIEELERQYQAAVSRRDQAQRDAQDAYTRLQAGRLAASGLSGHLVRGRRWPTSPEYTFIVESISGWNHHEIKGRVLKKDGTLGLNQIDMAIANVTDLGPYVAPGDSP